jgi:hypothetical protein
MSGNKPRSTWIPEFEYEEAEDGLTSKIPFIQVPDEEKMPALLYVFESRDTGEVEPGPEGEELPVTEITLHQYANMGICKARMNSVEYDNLRFTLGLESFQDAAIKGQEITTNIRQKIDQFAIETEENT